MEGITREDLINSLMALHSECPECHGNPIDCQLVKCRMKSRDGFEEYLNSLAPEVLWDMLDRHNSCQRKMEHGNQAS